MIELGKLLTAVNLSRNRAGLYEVQEIDAMANVYSSQKYGISLQVNPDQGRAGLPYFKAYNSYQYTKATSVARISMEMPTYIVHKNSDGKTNWVLNNKERQHLMLALQDNSRLLVVGFGRINVWQALILFYNSEKIGLPHELTMRLTRKNRVDFLSEYGKVYDNLRFALPIDLPTPDYTKLKE